VPESVGALREVQPHLQVGRERDRALTAVGTSAARGGDDVVSGGQVREAESAGGVRPHGRDGCPHEADVDAPERRAARVGHGARQRMARRVGEHEQDRDLAILDDGEAGLGGGQVPVSRGRQVVDFRSGR